MHARTYSTTVTAITVRILICIINNSYAFECLHLGLHEIASLRVVTGATQRCAFASFVVQTLEALIISSVINLYLHSVHVWLHYGIQLITPLIISTSRIESLEARTARSGTISQSHCQSHFMHVNVLWRHEKFIIRLSLVISWTLFYAMPTWVLMVLASPTVARHSH